MPILRKIRLLGLAVAAGALACLSLISVASPAGAVARSGVCIPLLPTTCPPKTVATTAPTTKAPTPTTAVPKRPTVTTTPAKVHPSASRSAPLVGAGGVAVPTLAPGDLGLAVDPAAPQLAANPAPSISSGSNLPALSGLVAAKALPPRHPTVRFALTLVVLLVAGMAAAQLPASRRRPRPAVDTAG